MAVMAWRIIDSFFIIDELILTIMYRINVNLIAECFNIKHKSTVAKYKIDRSILDMARVMDSHPHT